MDLTLLKFKFKYKFARVLKKQLNKYLFQFPFNCLTMAFLKNELNVLHKYKYKYLCNF